MSVIRNQSPMIKERNVRADRIHKGRVGHCSQCALCMHGDVANLDEIEGIDFAVINQDLLEYIAATF